MNEETDNRKPEAERRLAPVSLLDRIAQLDALIEPLTDERAALKQKLLESKSEISVGDVITWRDGKRKARVLKIVPWCCGEPMWLVKNIKSDGSDGMVCKVYPYLKPLRSNDPKLSHRRTAALTAKRN